ncbi:MAG: sirohydrochlorin chelatase [Bacillota bacterium]
MRTGVILLGHGSRMKEAESTLQGLVDKVNKSGKYNLVLGAALQFNSPDLPASLEKAVSCGMERIIVVPLFLCMGTHMKKDIPEIIEEQKKKYNGVDIKLAGNIGADDKLVEIIFDRIGEV